MTATSAVSTSPADRTQRGVEPSGGPRRIRVGIIGATGYVGAELIRLLARHPHVAHRRPPGSRPRPASPSPAIHPHLSRDRARRRRGPAGDGRRLPRPPPRHGGRARPGPGRRRHRVIDLGPDFRLRDPADYPRWYGFEHPHPDLLARAVYGLPELHRAELAALGDADVAIVGSPGCYPTTTILALAPLARAGLIGDLVVDAKSGVSGAGREAKPELMFGEVNESVKAYGVGGHRHVAEMEQELGSRSSTAHGSSRRTRAPRPSTSCPTSSR